MFRHEVLGADKARKSQTRVGCKKYLEDPKTAVSYDQRKDRTANVGFDDFETETAPLPNAGLAQGSPLSPILIAFFNSDLVDQPVDFHGGASAFIDDYFRWRAGRSTEENLRKIQEEDIPCIEAAEKTELIYITRKSSEKGKGQIIMQGRTIKPSDTAKLLGVVFDCELRWKEHVQSAVKRATQVNLAMCGLRHLRPAQMRQVYRACITPIMDYASTVWHSPLKGKTHLRALATVQRAALIRILSAFRTVATATLEVESFVLPTHLRLKQRAQHVIARLHTLPSCHPIREVLQRAQRRSQNAGSQASFALAQTMKVMAPGRLNHLETIDPKPLPPWEPDAFVEIYINLDGETAEQEARNLRATPGIVVYSDASGHDGQLGAAAIALDDNLTVKTDLRRLVLKLAHKSQHSQQPATVLSDSMSGLQAIKNPSNKSGQRIIHAILRAAWELAARGIPLRLQWIPGHCDDPGNDTADHLAKEAVGLRETHPFRHLLSRERCRIRNQIHQEWEREWNTSKTGGHRRQTDPGPPSIHNLRLFGNLSRGEAYLLMQMRSGHSWLATYGQKYGFREDDKCECGAKETVVHVLIDCPKLRALRQNLRKDIGEAMNDVTVMLGGKGRLGKADGSGESTQKSTLRAVLAFAEASSRFRSRGTRGPPGREPRHGGHDRP
ncbi:hypothetical protein EYZ11_010103 [Aspergillus tanneri]|uniref:RNase H type-1 domain-containing protein n=1 Tax=Aspergillus tanneri TaxID=1220188 RepID=A0A4S3J656_9EURO|nr:hypothetical protein EYZ11_010103 [Aspergillus tanneri]